MGFQAESATWRNAYLLGAHEYRSGPPPAQATMGNSLMNALTNAMLFDALAVRLNAPKAGAQAFTMSWYFTDLNEHWLLVLSNGALNSIQVEDPPPADVPADVSLALTRPTLEALLQQQLLPMQAVGDGRLKISGNALLLATFFGLLDRFSGSFAVVDAAPWPA